MLPRRGRSSPATVFSSVLLPAPLGPSSATISPGPTVSDTADSTRMSPYAASRSRMSSTHGALLIGAEIDVDDGGVRRDRCGRSLGDLLAGAQHDDPPR